MKAFILKQALNYLEKDPEKNAPKLMEWIDSVCPEDWYKGQRKTMRNILVEKGNWYDFILRIYELDPEVRKTFSENFFINSALNGNNRREEIKKKNNCNVPWAILMDPTSACNLQCIGCWAAEYGHQLSLDFDTLDSIITQGKALGTYVYLYTGGEPLVRKNDIIRLCEKHPDCEFFAFTNGTLIDEAFCKELLRVKNFMPAISLEGFENANDERRGEGVYQKVMDAMKLLKKHKLPFGVSTCYTSKNVDVVSSEEFFDLIIENGALFAWFFHYMPVGNAAVTELLPSPEQREGLCQKIRHYRDTKPIFSLDFQNDGEYVGGCIAGGREYFHINANGDAEPCAFIHYSNANIKDTSLLDILKSPLFMAYHKYQPFNENLLMPCPMLENPECLKHMVYSSGATSTDYQEPEDIEQLCKKCSEYAKHWKPTADRMWTSSHL